MSKQLIDVGVNLNDGTGDNLRTAGEKINSMMSEIYTTFGDGTILTATINGLQHVRDDSEPQLGGLLDLNGYGVNGNGEIFITGRIATGMYVEAGQYLKGGSLDITNSGSVGGALTIGGITTGTVGNFTTSVTTGTLNATTQLQVVGDASVTGKVTAQGAGSKVRFYYPDSTTFPAAADWEGGLAYSEATNKMSVATDGSWKTLANEDSPALTGTPTAPTAATATNTTQIATTAYVQAHRGEIDTALGLKAPLASPAFTGTPTAPTQAKSDNDTSIATTKFVHDVVADYAPLNNAALTGAPTAPTPSPADDNSTKIATTAFVAGREEVLNTAIGLKAPTASPSFTGTPTAPTPVDNTTTTRIATTGYVVTTLGTAVTTINTALGLKAPLASPALTGTPTAPTAAAGTNTTQIATTAFVKTHVDGAVTDLNMSDYAKKASPSFSGTPTAPTPAASSNDTTIATTAFTKTAVANGSAKMWDGSHKFVSTSAPSNSDGVDGDIWFQIEA